MSDSLHCADCLPGQIHTTKSDHPFRSKGKTMRELHAIVAADNARWDTLAEHWNNLTEDEQKKLVAIAAAMAAEGDAV